MEQKIINPFETNPEERLKQLNEEMKTQVESLNSKLSPSSKNDGSWIYVEGHGILWEPFPGDRMGAPLLPPTDKPSPLLEGLVEWGKRVDFDSLPENAVLMIKIGIQDPVYAQKMQYGVIKQVLEPRITKLKEKKITVLFMSTLDDISSMTSEEMEQAGWVKKDKPLIITDY